MIEDIINDSIFLSIIVIKDVQKLHKSKECLLFTKISEINQHYMLKCDL